MKKHPSRRPRIAILSFEGWGLRTWVLSGFVECLAERADVIVFTPDAARAREQYSMPGVSFEEARTPPLGRWALTVLRTLGYAQAYRRRSVSDRALLARKYSDLPLRSRIRQRLMHTSARLLTSAPPMVDRRIEQLTLGMMAESKRLEPLLDGVDLVYSTLPLVSHYERPALWAARRLGIRTACMVTSWDNLTTKSRFPVPFTHYLVWSDYMRDELLRVFADVERSAVTVTGPPQFDFYAKRSLSVSREEFCRSIGADPQRPIVLWAGVSPNLMPNEPALVAEFCDAVRAGRVTGSPQILLRPHPIGGGSRFQEMRSRYPELLFTETNAAHPNLIGWMPRLDDMSLLVNSIAHCAVNVNYCSTMALDCCALDRPVVNIVYDTMPGSRDAEQIRSLARQDHYQSVVDAGAVRKAYSLSELLTHVNAYLEDPSLEREGRARALALQCGTVDGFSARRAAETVLRVAGVDSQIASEVLAIA